MKKKKNNDITNIPGVGKALARRFHQIGITTIADLKGQDPEELYANMCAKQGGHVDRCVLYVCRSSVYFAEHTHHDSEKLKWWNWKDGK